MWTKKKTIYASVAAGIIAGAAIGAGIGVAMGVFGAIPTGGISILATPVAVAIFGGIGAIFGAAIGLIGGLITSNSIERKSREISAMKEEFEHDRDESFDESFDFDKSFDFGESYKQVIEISAEGDKELIREVKRKSEERSQPAHFSVSKENIPKITKDDGSEKRSFDRKLSSSISVAKDDPVLKDDEENSDKSFERSRSSSLGSSV